MSFEPELGQYAFSNTPWKTLEMQHSVREAIGLLGAVLDNDGDWSGDPTSNTGAEFANDTFALRGYCWCDGAELGHEDGCPPNFKYGVFEACWYKHLDRGASQNRSLTNREVAAMVQDCLRSLEGLL